MSDQPPNQGPPESIKFNQFSGIKNTVTRERLTPAELEVAKNVDIDDVGQLHRRRGYVKKGSGNYHSLFRTEHGQVYCVKDGALGRLEPNYTFVQIAAGVGTDPLAYVALDDTVYFSSASTSGKFSRLTNIPSQWGALAAEQMWLSPVVNPVEGLPPIKGKLLARPPLATALAYLNGRIYLATDGAVWATELYLYDWVDTVKGFLPFEGNVRVVAAVTDGLYVGTDTAIWYLTGAFNEMRRVQVAEHGALPGSAVSVPSDVLPEELARGERGGVMIMTSQGLCVGLDGGQFVNLMRSKVIFPAASRANSLFRMQDGVNHYLCVADSGGTPTSNTRIGDYVDAEIRRFQGA